MSMSAAVTLDSLRHYLTSESTSVRPTSWEVSLHTAAPGSSGVANEVADSSYARQSVTFAVDAADATAPIASNISTVTFASAASGYTAAYAVVWDSTNNSPLVIQRLITDKVIAQGEQAQFAVGELKIGGRN